MLVLGVEGKKGRDLGVGHLGGSRPGDIRYRGAVNICGGSHEVVGGVSGEGAPYRRVSHL